MFQRAILNVLILLGCVVSQVQADHAIPPYAAEIHPAGQIGRADGNYGFPFITGCCREQRGQHLWDNFCQPHAAWRAKCNGGCGLPLPKLSLHSLFGHGQHGCGMFGCSGSCNACGGLSNLFGWRGRPHLATGCATCTAATGYPATSDCGCGGYGHSSESMPLLNFDSPTPIVPRQMPPSIEYDIPTMPYPATEPAEVGPGSLQPEKEALPIPVEPAPAPAEPADSGNNSASSFSHGLRWLPTSFGQ